MAYGNSGENERTGEIPDGRSRSPDFSAPLPYFFETTDDRAVREKILGITQSEAGKLGISRSTLHYLRKNAKAKESFRIYAKVRGKLNGELAA